MDPEAEAVKRILEKGFERPSIWELPEVFNMLADNGKSL